MNDAYDNAKDDVAILAKLTAESDAQSDGQTIGAVYAIGQFVTKAREEAEDAYCALSNVDNAEARAVIARVLMDLRRSEDGLSDAFRLLTEG